MQVDLQRAPPVWKCYGEEASMRDWDCSLWGKVYLQVLEWVDSPRHWISPGIYLTEQTDTCMFMLITMHVLSCLLLEFLPSLSYTLTSRRDHAFILQWAKHLAPSICLHSHLSATQRQGWADGEKVSTREVVVLCQQSTLAFNSCSAEIQRDQLIPEVQILLGYNSTYTEVGFKYHSLGFKYDWTNVFY